jgi:lysine-specific demethylase/histidyl-hydroxylase NO66
MEMIDAASDQHVKSFILQRLPVPLHETEEKRSAAGTPEAKIFPFTVLRMIRPGVARAVVEDGMIIVYHCMDNARLQEETVVSPIEFDIDDGPAIEALLSAYPRGVEVSDLPHPSEELDDKVSVAAALYKEGFLYIEDEGTLPFEREIGDSENSDDPF